MLLLCCVVLCCIGGGLGFGSNGHGGVSGNVGGGGGGGGSGRVCTLTEDDRIMEARRRLIEMQVENNIKTEQNNSTEIFLVCSPVLQISRLLRNWKELRYFSFVFSL